MSDTLIKCENVGKKFCRDFKKSLWYGVKDSFSELFWHRSSSAAGNHSSLANAELRSGEFWANQQINFKLSRGECLGLIGHNGAGKTTLLKMLNGLIKPDVGNIQIRGNVSALIALGAGFNPVLTGRENLMVNSLILGRSRAATIGAMDQIISFSEIDDAIDAPVRTYSSGMQVRLGFAIAAQANPDLMLVDEVLAVGDNAFQKKCYDRIYELRQKGTSFIVVSHNPYQLERLCDSIALMSAGNILKLTDPKEAIHLYHLERQKNLPKLANPPDVQREGTGQARFSRVFIADHTNMPSTEIETGQKFSVHAECAFGEPLKDIRVRFMIYSQSNTLICNIGSVGQSESWENPEGTSCISFYAENCLILAGAYFIEAVIVNARGERLDRIGQACLFSVITRQHAITEQTASTGLIYIAGKWSRDPGFSKVSTK
jgi:lipopolysaccharide transport system ATP-binding protein